MLLWGQRSEDQDKKLFVATQEGPLDQRATEIQRGASLETTNNHSAPSCHDIKLTSYKLYYIVYYIDNDDLLTVERFLHFFAAKYVVQLHCVIIAPALGVLPNCFSLSTSIKKSFSIIYLIQFYNFVSLSRGSNKHQNVYGSVSYLPAAITVAVAGDCLL